VKGTGKSLFCQGAVGMGRGSSNLFLKGPKGKERSRRRDAADWRAEEGEDPEQGKKRAEVLLIGFGERAGGKFRGVPIFTKALRAMR